MYKRNAELKEGWLALVQCWLLFRPKEFDNELTDFCYVLDILSLQVLPYILEQQLPRADIITLIN